MPNRQILASNHHQQPKRRKNIQPSKINVVFENRHGARILVTQKLSTILINPSSCATLQQFLHGIHCGTFGEPRTSTSCDQCRLCDVFWPFRTIHNLEFWLRGIRKQRRFSFGCGRILGHNDGKEYASCCAFYQMNWFP